MKKFLLALLLVTATVQAYASVITVGSTGAGWCNSGSCDNYNTHVFENNDIQSTIRNWEAFTLGTGSFSAATLSIYESSQYASFNSGSGDINFYIASAINYAGLQNGPSIGTIKNGSSEPTGAYVNINLNAYGIQQLNLLQGQSFIIGGSNGGATIDAFGFSSSNTPAAYLTLTTAVPEPGSVALLGMGLFALAISRRRSAK